MKFVALVSGGKDSCFNILHCLAQGHQLVALANLKPADPQVQELDSFMFQTVGHDVLEFYSECVGAPMYRGLINGTSKNRELNYERTEEDEIEDLYNLLRDIKEKHPEIDSVSVGAILSSYQRTRVEDVCSRLGLTSLAYLWQRDQLELMTEMVESSMDARLIKVAAIGLNQSHLGKSLKEMYPILLRLNQKFDVHICGEGGEFESLVLDAPFFIKKLEILESKKFNDDQVAYMEPIVKVVEKTEEDGEYHNVNEADVDWKRFIPSEAGLLRNSFKDILDDVKPSEAEILNSSASLFDSIPLLTTKILNNKLFISNITSDKGSVEEQTYDVFNQLNSILRENNLKPSNIQHSTLLVSSMSNFATINSIYVKNFTEPLPPSRVCVQTSLPANKHLQLSTTVLLSSSLKTGLHVQGRSYWAPANIGPYSQTIIDENLTASLSGQIPLIPSSMELSTESQLFNSVLSLQHFDSVKKAVGCNIQLSTVAFIKNFKSVRNVVNTWRSYSELNEDENPVDVLLVFQVEELPRGADTEWGGLSYKKLVNMYEDDDDEKELDKFRSMDIAEGSHRGNNGELVTTLALTEHEFNNLKLRPDSHYTIYTQPGRVTVLESISVEYIPVLNVWNYDGELKDYGIIIRSKIQV